MSDSVELPALIQSNQKPPPGTDSICQTPSTDGASENESHAGVDTEGEEPECRQAAGAATTDNIGCRRKISKDNIYGELKRVSNSSSADEESKGNHDSGNSLLDGPPFRGPSLPPKTGSADSERKALERQMPRFMSLPQSRLKHCYEETKGTWNSLYEPQEEAPKVPPLPIGIQGRSQSFPKVVSNQPKKHTRGKLSRPRNVMTESVCQDQRTSVSASQREDAEELTGGMKSPTPPAVPERTDSISCFNERPNSGLSFFGHPEDTTECPCPSSRSTEDSQLCSTASGDSKSFNGNKSSSKRTPPTPKPRTIFFARTVMRSVKDSGLEKDLVEVSSLIHCDMSRYFQSLLSPLNY